MPALDTGIRSTRSLRNRRRIMDLVESEPGIHKSAICRRLGLAWGTVTHHLDKMAAIGLMRAGRVGNQRCYVSPATVRESSLAKALMWPHARAILHLLLTRGVAGPAQISDHLGIGAKTVRGHVQALLAAGLVTSDGSYHPRYWISRDRCAHVTELCRRLD